MYIWNLEKWHWWTYLQVMNRDAGVENRHTDKMGVGKEGQRNWRAALTYDCHVWNSLLVRSCCPAQGAQASALWRPRWVGWRVGRKEVSRGIYVCECAKLLQLCPTLRDPMDFSLPGSSVHGILQARILEWVAMPSSVGSSWCRDLSLSFT